MFKPKGSPREDFLSKSKRQLGFWRDNLCASTQLFLKVFEKHVRVGTYIAPFCLTKKVFHTHMRRQASMFVLKRGNFLSLDQLTESRGSADGLIRHFFFLLLSLW